ncbi:sec1 family domain-containing protein 2-like [Penaeus monodon]|uniref:sec1 family domain-containing protein 2-like n=1 Tax=Penaeus monodon TaxID=6687 RepID=UPI0018A7E14C|nr:sec1 family domain-containing protein 2-like [Penaeus monodon]
MQFASAVHVSEAWWAEACKKVKNAVVFVDNASAECLHWNGGLARLVEAGAKNVKEFSSFECGNKGDVKAVFMLGTAVVDITAKILEDIIHSSNFEYCVVITAGHPNVHAYARYGGRETDEGVLMNQLEQTILGWMGNMNYTVEIFYIPLVVVPYSESLFFMPPFADLYPLLNTDVARLAKLQQAQAKGERVKLVESLADVEFHHLPFEMRIMIRQFVVCIHSLMQGMNARDEIFSVGHTARIIGSELDSFNPARQRRKNAANKVSIVLVDRTLDLAAASIFSGETLMERILCLLPRLFGHHLDSAVSMAPLCQVHPSSEWTLIPGCLAPQGNEKKAKEVLAALVLSSRKEALSLLNKHVLQAANRKEAGSGEVDKAGKMTIGNLKKNIQTFASDIEAFSEHASLLQQGLGVVEALSDERHEHLDQLLSLQKLLLQSIGDAEETPPFTQILQLLKTRGTHGVSLDDVLTLMVYATSLGGSSVFSQRDEYALTNLLSHAIVEDKLDLSDNLLEIIGEDVDEVSALKASQSIASQLHAIATARDHLKNYKNLHIPGDAAQPASCQGLLQKLVHDSLTAPQTEITDIEYRSAGFKDLIKTGFSLFVNVSKPMPRDAPAIIVYVIGGVTAGEVREIKQRVEEVGPPCEVLLASSHLAHPSDTIARALKPSPFIQNL